jgi:hypothetical protein
MKGITMRRVKFEEIHKNKKFAFLDGFLCGVLITYLVIIAVTAKPVKTVFVSSEDTSTDDEDLETLRTNIRNES